MQILPLTLKHDGFDFRQVVREDMVAIYGQYRGELLIGYELIVIQVHKEHQWPNGKVTLEGEHYPRSEGWGSIGWTFKSLDDAKAHMTALRHSAAA